MPAEQLQTLHRAIAILDCFTQENTELGVREIARMVNLSSSATGRLLAAMKEMGILSQNPETRAYSMGARVLNLGWSLQRPARCPQPRSSSDTRAARDHPRDDQPVYPRW